MPNRFSLQPWQYTSAESVFGLVYAWAYPFSIISFCQVMYVIIFEVWAVVDAVQCRGGSIHGVLACRINVPADNPHLGSWDYGCGVWTLLFFYFFLFFFTKNHYAPVSLTNWWNMTFTALVISSPLIHALVWPESSPHWELNSGPQHERWMTYRLSYPSPHEQFFNVEDKGYCIYKIEPGVSLNILYTPLPL